MEPDGDDEADLVTLARSGDERALAALLAAYRGDVLAYLERHTPAELRPYVDPQDLLQDAYLDACRGIAGFTPDGPQAVRRWLYTLARNRVLAQLRQGRALKRGGRLPDGDPSPDTAGDDGPLVRLLDELVVHQRTPSRSASRHELVAALHRSIDRLKPDHRQAIWLRHVEGLRVDECASRMNRSQGAFLLLCNRGFKELRRELRSASRFL